VFLVILFTSFSGSLVSRISGAVQWVEARNHAGKISGILTDFTFHDLKAKGISDYEGSSRDKQLFSGHKTEGQVLIYDRKVKVSPTLDVPLPENIPRKYSK
ncbi:putative integrase, partial [Escherichia coli EC96038]